MSGIILEKLLIMMIMGLIGFVCGKAGLIDGDTISGFPICPC